MIYKCIIKENNESDIVVRINNVDLLCFANAGLFDDIEDEMFLDIELYDEFDISISNEKVGIKRISGYQYKITGVLNIEKGGIDSLIFFPIDDLYDYGMVPQEIILDFEGAFGIKLPKLYIKLITKHNALGIIQSYFDYYDSYRNEDEYSSFGFEGFETESNKHEPPENIFAQYLYDDDIYGYKHVYSFGRSGCGDFVCFDYRDNPKGSEPKICLVIHDEYDEETGKRLLFPVAENFEAFLDMLYDFDERYPNGYE